MRAVAAKAQRLRAEVAEIAHESLLKAWPRLVRWQAQDVEGARMRDDLRQAARRWARPAPAAVSELRRLQQISAQLRDRATRGDVLNLVLEYAAESFGRVAVFMVRDEVAVGIAQRGLAAAAGPGDEEFCELEVSLDEPAWFRAAVDTKTPDDRFGLVVFDGDAIAVSAPTRTELTTDMPEEAAGIK